MNLIAHAEKALFRNWRVVVLYTLANLAVIATYFACEFALDNAVPEDTLPKPLWYVGAGLLLEIGLAALVAAFQAVAFARMGAEIDRPLWKYGNAADALRRFFVLWLIIALIFFAIDQVQASLARLGLVQAAIALDLPRLLWTCVSLPIGVCIMFGGNLKWEEIPDRLSPIVHLFPKAMVAFMLGFLEYFLVDLSLGQLPESYQKSVLVATAINLPLVLLDCLAFAVMWLVCMEYRDTAIERDDDFDF